MIKSITRQIEVKLLSDSQKCYRVKNGVNLIPDTKDFIPTISGSQRLIINTTAVNIPNLINSIGIIFQSMKNKCVMRINPLLQNPALIETELANILADLRNKTKASYDNVAAIVVGGKTFDINKPELSSKSSNCVDAICDFFEGERNLPSIKMLEQNLGENEKGINIYSYRDNIVLSGGGVKNMIEESNLTGQKFSSSSKNHFEIFNIPSNMRISVVDEILPPSNVPKMYMSK